MLMYMQLLRIDRLVTVKTKQHIPILLQVTLQFDKLVKLYVSCSVLQHNTPRQHNR